MPNREPPAGYTSDQVVDVAALNLPHGPAAGSRIEAEAKRPCPAKFHMRMERHGAEGRGLRTVVADCRQHLGHAGPHNNQEADLVWSGSPLDGPGQLAKLRTKVRDALTHCSTHAQEARDAGRESWLNEARVDAYDWVLQRLDELEAEPAEPQPPNCPGPSSAEAVAMLDEADRLLGAPPTWADNPGVKSIEIAQAQHLATRAQIGLLRALLAGAR